MASITTTEIVAGALEEDLGDGDVTTAATVPEEARASALIKQKAPGVLFGIELAAQTFLALDPGAEFERLAAEGIWREGGSVLIIEASARAILSAERTALNFLQRLSGVATLTARCVKAIEGTGITGAAYTTRY
jgi:nicotinate-nucleotide pyrophosphorylase (carboxylating)